MKNKIAIASAFLAASSFSMGEIVVNDFLSFEGFVDSSYSTNQSDIEGVTESDNSFGIDQVEISWLFNFDAVTAQIDLEYEDGAGDNNDGVEQAFVNYALGNGDVITAGRYASMLGFEAFEPTGLYQYSTAYDFSGILGDAGLAGLLDGATVSEYSQGVKFTRSTDTTFFGISVQDQAFGSDADRLGGDGDVDQDSSFGVEVAGSIDLGNGFTVFAGVAFEDAEFGDNQLINAYVTYETGAWLFAAEINVSDYDDVNLAGVANLGNVDGLTGLLMANYAYSDVASVTGRISSINYESSDVELDILKYTVAHNYALSDNLLLVTEVSLDDGELDVDGLGNADGDNLTLAVELLFTF
ncbi:MAG: hypothetical protein ABF320_05060 [Lentimonas sp.]